MSSRVLFDLYGVLLQEEAELSLECLNAVVDPQVADQLLQQFLAVQHDLDIGMLSDERWWKEVCIEAGLSEKDCRLLVEALHSAFHPNVDVVALAYELIDRGWVVGALGNITLGNSLALRGIAPWLNDLAGVVLSCDVGLCFPDAPAFQVACDALSAQPKETYYLGSSAKYLDAARQVGLHAVRFESADQARTALLGSA